MRTILINSSHLVKGTTNQYKYQFPKFWNAQPGAQIALASISVYNSTFNITAELENNTIELIFFPNQSFVFVLPDGYYSISDINLFLEQQMILNRLYAVTQSGKNVYFISISENPSRYSAQINLYPVQHSVSYSIPDDSSLVVIEGIPGIPNPFRPEVPKIVLSQGLGRLLGFPMGQFPEGLSYEPVQFVSADFDTFPMISPVDTYTILCSIIKNPYSNPNTFFFQLPLSVGLGQIVTYSSSSLVWNDVNSMQHRDITLTLADQFGMPLKNKDTSFTCTLVLQDAPSK